MWHEVFRPLNIILLYIGITHPSNSIPLDEYFIMLGFTEFNPANAPFLNLIRYLPLVVPPSGYIINGE